MHGGYGDTGDFNVEQLYRDNRLNAIHEGTHAIHGLDLLGRKVTMDSGAGLRALLNAMTAKRAAARYFFSYELPRTAAQFDLLASLDRSMLDLSESWF